MSQQTLSAINELQPIAKRLREREDLINEGKKKLYANIGDLTELAYEQGRDIIMAKSKASKAIRWSEWLHIHVPNLPMQQASKYERVATEQLTDPRQCIFAFIPQENDTHQAITRTKPAPWEVAWGFVHKLIVLAKTKPIEGWNEDHRSRLADELEPVAKALWPEKF